MKFNEWTYMKDEYGVDGFGCTKCGFFVPWDYTHKFIGFIKDYRFCPRCGIDSVVSDAELMRAVENCNGERIKL